MRSAWAVDPAYRKLVSETPPKVIHTREENAFYLAKFEELIGAGIHSAGRKKNSTRRCAC